MANPKYCVTLYKAFKGSKRLYNSVEPDGFMSYIRFSAEKLVRDLDGRELITRFTDIIYTHKEPKGINVDNVDCVLLAKQVGILGYFTKNDLKKSELSIDKDDLWMVKQLYKTGTLVVATDYRLRVFKSRCKSEAIRKAFTERYFGEYDLSFSHKPYTIGNGTKNWFIVIGEVVDD